MTHAALKDRDPTKPNTDQGLYRKFDVFRTDLSDQPGGKHHGCEYFVLDLTHDPHAKAALAAYAVAVNKTHPQLAADLCQRYELAALSAMEGEAVAWEVAITGLSGNVYRFAYVERPNPEAFGPNTTLRPLIYGDTAPPPQQAGKDFEFGGYCGTCGSPCDDQGRSIHGHASTHPTPSPGPQGGGEAKCGECFGTGELCLAGRSAHPSNWYPCPKCSATPPQPEAGGGEALAVGEVRIDHIPEDWGRYPAQDLPRVTFYGDAPPAGAKLFLHPAQPASQQGEVPYGWIEPPTGNFVDHATKLEMPRDAATFTLPVFTRPAADKVRSLPAKWRATASDLERDHAGDERADGIVGAMTQCADELAAALDQPNGENE